MVLELLPGCGVVIERLFRWVLQLQCWDEVVSLMVSKQMNIFTWTRHVCMVRYEL